MAFFSAAMEPTELSVLVQSCVEDAIADCRLLMKTAAFEMDIPLSMLSEGLTGAKHLSLQRLSRLGRVFLLHFCKRVMRELGGVAYSAEERDILLGAAYLGPKRMARMTRVQLPLSTNKEQAS